MIAGRGVQSTREQRGEQGTLGNSEETSLQMGHLRSRMAKIKGKGAGGPPGNNIKVWQEQRMVDYGMY